MNEYIKRHKRLKIWLALLILAVVTVFFYFIDFIQNNPRAKSLFAPELIGQFQVVDWIPFQSVASAGIGVLLIAALFEVWIRRESSEELQASLFDPKIIERNFSQVLADEVLVAALNTRFKEVDFSKEVARFITGGAFSNLGRRYDAHYQVKLLPPNSNESDDVRTHYFDAYLTFDFQKELSARTLHFRCTDSVDYFNSTLTDPNIEWRWLDTRKRLFQNFDKSFFELLDFSVQGDSQTVLSNPISGGGGDVGYSVRVPNNFKLGERYRFRYRVRIKVESLSNCFFVDVREPTKGIRVDFDFGNVPIARVNAFDSFSTSKPARPEFLPNQLNPKSVMIHVDDEWVIPKSGALFSWILKAHEDPGFKQQHLVQMQTAR